MNSKKVILFLSMISLFFVSPMILSIKFENQCKNLNSLPFLNEEFKNHPIDKIKITAIGDPILENLTESSDPLELGQKETIRIDADDNETFISKVLIEIGLNNYTMNNIGGNTYNYSWTPSSVGIITYKIYANDTENNFTSTSGSIQIIGIGPSYSNLIKTDPLNLTHKEEIWIDVTDISGVSHVIVDFEGTNYTMAKIGGDTYFNDSWIPSSKGEYPFTIYMNDTYNNWTTLSDTIQVIDYNSSDLLDPTINMSYPLQNEILANTTFEIGGFINGTKTNISAIYINRNDLFNLTLDPRNTTSGNYRFTNFTVVPTGYYNITITVYDQGFNMANVSRSFYVDFDTPNINIVLTELLYEVGIERSINTTIEDIDPNVTAILTYSILGNSTELNITMTNLGGYIHNCLIPAQPYGVIVFFKVSANDTLGNINTTSWLNYTVIDTTKPKIDTILFTQLPFEVLPSDFLLMLVSVQEESYGSPIHEVALYYSWGLPFLKMLMVGNSPSYLAFLPKFEADTIILYYFNATDIAGNSYISPIYVTRVVPEALGMEIWALLITISIAIAIGVISMLWSRRYEKKIQDEIKSKKETSKLKGKM